MRILSYVSLSVLQATGDRAGGAVNPRARRAKASCIGQLRQAGRGGVIPGAPDRAGGALANPWIVFSEGSFQRIVL
jgi:hypothetical protein